MTQELTIYAADEMKIFGNVVVAGNDTVACVMYDDGVDAFAINHAYDQPGRVQLFFNERDEQGKLVTRSWDVDPIKLTHALTRLVREAKENKEDAFT